MQRFATECYGMLQFRKNGPGPNQADSPLADSLQPHPSLRVCLVEEWEQNDEMRRNATVNATECYGMLHPDGAGPAIRTNKQRLTRTDATECYGMLRNATVCEKAGTERDLWRVDSGQWGAEGPLADSPRRRRRPNATECYSQRYRMLRNATECYTLTARTRRSAPTNNDLQERMRQNVTECYGMLHFAKKQAGSETCIEWRVVRARAACGSAESAASLLLLLSTIHTSAGLSTTCFTCSCVGAERRNATVCYTQCYEM